MKNLILSIFILGLPFFTSAADGAGSQTAVLEGYLRSADNQAADAGRQPPAEMADMIPLAAELVSRLRILENQIRSGPDVSVLEKKYETLEANLEDFSVQLQHLRDSEDYRYTNLMELKGFIRQKNNLLEEINEPLDQAIAQLDSRRKEWLAEQEKWTHRQSSLIGAQAFEQLQSTFEEVNTTINTALELIHAHLKTLLGVQVRAGRIWSAINIYANEIDERLAKEWRNVLYDTTPPMFSARYASQFSSDLWIAVKRGVGEISWPSRQFMEQEGWIVLLQGFLSLAVILLVYRNRPTLSGLDHWRFLARRPISGGLFFFCIPAILIYEYEGAADVWKVAILIVAGICFIRLSAVLAKTSWGRGFAYGLVILYITTRFLNLIMFPVPLFRLYTAVASLAVLVFCFRRGHKGIRPEEPGFILWLRRISALFFAVILIAEVAGKTALASYLFLSSILSMATVFAFLLFGHLIGGSIEWLFRTSLLQRASVLYSDTTSIINRLTRFTDIAIWGLVLLPSILTIWGVYDSLAEATVGLLGLGFQWGSQRFTIGLFLVALGIIYGSFLVSWIFQKLFLDVVLRTRRVDRGSQHSIKQLIHYVILVVGFLMALSILGFEATKITILLGALGVGIGFGLQGIVNNLVSGLVLLFERPVRVGDTIQLGDHWAEIRRIGLRSTLVKTLDEADVIIPNADLIANQVINWTLTNRLVRLSIPVGVAYGSDVAVVMETLAACAKDRDKVATYPAPQVLFLRFGESSLDFELRCWVTDADHRLTVKSELHAAIDRAFREKKIEIAFPQRDLHLRSVDDSAVLRISENRQGRSQEPLSGIGKEEPASIVPDLKTTDRNDSRAKQGSN